MLEFFSQALATKAEYVAVLPSWVQHWMSFMSIIFGSGVLFAFQYPQARWLLVSTIGSVIAALIWGGLYGFGPLWALFHIVFYTPFLIYLYLRRDWLGGSKIFKMWLMAASATMVISLLFDWFDLIRYLIS